METNAAPPARRLLGVGVGPGEPELVTLKAVRAFREADTILVPSTEQSSDHAGRAEQIVLAVCPESAPRIIRIPFAMAERRGVGQRRQSAWDASAAAAVAAFESGAGSVCFATVGDPSVYSTFSYLAAEVTAALPEVIVEVIPGITAMQALAAASRTPLCEGREVLALVPVTSGLETLDAALDWADTVVAYKGGRRLPEVIDRLRERGRDQHSVLGTDIGLPTEQLVRVAELSETDPAPYFSTVLAAPRRTRTGGRL